MESTEGKDFDATLGGTEHLPQLANHFKFATSRSIEIAAMTENILRPSQVKLIFQSLPVHMRRRVMSHNSKRLPKHLREAHTQQFSNSGFAIKQKRPSRKHRRRPTNLLEEYNRRKRTNMWLETHIWHAKRFHMITRWGHRLAYSPCDKAFRACYRATSAHCLMQDISYLTPIQIRGPLDTIKEMFNSITNSSCGLGICAKAFIDGKREGSIGIYEKNAYPFGYIGKVQFIWTKEKDLWLFIHPSQTKQVESLLANLTNLNNNNDLEPPHKQRKVQFSNIYVRSLPGAFNRFRLTGPNSHAILTDTFKCVACIEKIKAEGWLPNYDLNLEEKNKYWTSLHGISSPSQLPPRLMLDLVVKDPRLSRPLKRTKSKCLHENTVVTDTLLTVPSFQSSSSLWNPEVLEKIKSKVMTNRDFIQHVTKTQLIPGQINLEDPTFQSVPVVLIQRPGSQVPEFKKIGYGCGWDVIVPAGYGLSFWLTFTMFGGRSGGLRETESLAFEMGECYLPPDSKAGKIEEERIRDELKEKYFKLPPSKRINYLKLGINSPFICPWAVLLEEWGNKSKDVFFVLRDRKMLLSIQTCLEQKKPIPQLPNSNACVVPIHVSLIGKGNLKKHALICLPESNDMTNIKTLFEPHHEDKNEKVRKQLKKEHLMQLKRCKRKKLKMKKKGVVNKTKTQPKNKPSEYVTTMRELWLPSKVENVRYAGSRQVLGYILQGAFSFSEAQSCGVGYVAYNAISTLLQNGLNQVLVRNVSSRKYRLANIKIIMNV